MKKCTLIKKYFSFSMTILLCVTLIACGNKKNTDSLPEVDKNEVSDNVESAPITVSEKIKNSDIISI